jgi:hypothetical protein
MTKYLIAAVMLATTALTCAAAEGPHGRLKDGLEMDDYRTLPDPWNLWTVYRGTLDARNDPDHGRIMCGLEVRNGDSIMVSWRKMAGTDATTAGVASLPATSSAAA